MKWLTVTWSMSASACLSLGMVQLFIWLRQRDKFAHLLFSLVSFGVAGIAACELMMMRAQTPEEFGTVMRWAHLPVFLVILSTAGYVRVYFGTGRLALLITICVLRLAVLILNFSAGVNFNYTSITELRQVKFLFGEYASIAAGVPSPWAMLGPVSSVLFVLFILDASICLWRKGDAMQRRRARLVGGSISLFVLVAVCHSLLVNTGVLQSPYLMSLPFLVPMIVLAFELSGHVAQAASLGQQLATSRAAFLEMEQRISLAASAADLGFWEWDVWADTIWMSEKSREIFAVNGELTVSIERFLDRIQDEDRDGFRAVIDRSIREGGSYRAEFRVKQVAGGIRWVSLRGRVETLKEHKRLRLRGVAIDITDRRAMEQNFARQRSELAHLSRVTMLGELSGSLAHELNQPLTAILSNAQAATRFLAQDSNNLQEVRDILKDIIDADKRAGEIIRRLRLLFKKGEVEEQMIDINVLILEVLHFLNSDLINHMVVVQTELGSTLPPVKGDRVQLQQVLINIIINACDAMTHVEREKRMLTVSTDVQNDKRIAIAISDRGAGIPAAEVDRIFEPFVTTKPQGMGMGLAVCKTIITAHGGSLWASNNPAGGATFHLTLPAVQVEPVQEE